MGYPMDKTAILGPTTTWMGDCLLHLGAAGTHWLNQCLSQLVS